MDDDSLAYEPKLLYDINLHRMHQQKLLISRKESGT